MSDRKSELTISNQYFHNEKGQNNKHESNHNFSAEKVTVYIGNQVGFNSGYCGEIECTFE